jgi:ABC-type antimicrobial peptide transport system permease subunit
MFIVAIGATTASYASLIRDMNVLFNGQVLVVAKSTIVVQAIPLGGGYLGQETASDIEMNVNLTQKAVPVLFLTSISMGSGLQLVPDNFTIGLPVEDWQVLLGSTPLRTGGVWPTNDSSNDVVAGASLADQFAWTSGSNITVNGYRLKITGVLSTDSAILSRSLVMPLALAQKIYILPMQINMVAVTPVAGCSEEALANSIDQKIPDVKALTENERNYMIQPILSQVQTWNIGIETAIFLLSLILVLTVTTMNVSERRRDFATLDAMGAPLNFVFRTVLVEAALIGLIGGVVGVALGSLGAIVLASVYTNISIQQFFPSMFSLVSPVFMIEILASTIAVCCIGGIIPAIKAARTRISEVLRAEY